MGIVSGIVVYVIIWWTVIFCTLPLWVKRDMSGPETTAHGAPKDPKLKKKFLLTSLISAIIWCGVYVMIEWDPIGFRDVAREMSQQDY